MQSADHHEVPDVELSSPVQQGSLKVLLDDVGLLQTIEVLLLLPQDGVQLVDLVDHGNALASIG